MQPKPWCSFLPSHRLATKSIHRQAFPTAVKKRRARVLGATSWVLYFNYRFPRRALRKAFWWRTGWKGLRRRGWAHLWPGDLGQQQHHRRGQLLGRRLRGQQRPPAAATTGPRGHQELPAQRLWFGRVYRNKDKMKEWALCIRYFMAKSRVGVSKCLEPYLSSSLVIYNMMSTCKRVSHLLNYSKANKYNCSYPCNFNLSNLHIDMNTF